MDVQMNESKGEIDLNRWFTVALASFVMSYMLLAMAGGALTRHFQNSPFPEEVAVFFAALFHQTALLLLAGALACFLERSISPSRKLGMVRWRLFYLPEALGAEIVILPVLAVTVLVFGWLLEKWGIPYAKPPLIDFLLTCGTSSFLLVAFAAIVVAPLAEEIMFRRVMFEFFGRFIGPMWALLVTSAIFAAIHFSFIQLPALFLLGVVLQLLYLLHRSLFPSIIFHMTHNGVSMAILYMIKYGILPVDPQVLGSI